MKAQLYRINIGRAKYITLVYFMVLAIYDSILILSNNDIFFGDRYFYGNYLFIQSGLIGHFAIFFFFLTFPIIFYILFFRHLSTDSKNNILYTQISRMKIAKYIYRNYIVISLSTFIIMMMFQIVNIFIVWTLFYIGGLELDIPLESMYIFKKIVIHTLMFSTVITLYNTLFTGVYLLKINQYISLAVTIGYVYIAQMVFNLGNILQPFTEYSSEYVLKNFSSFAIFNLLLIIMFIIYNVNKKDFLNE